MNWQEVLTRVAIEIAQRQSSRDSEESIVQTRMGIMDSQFRRMGVIGTLSVCSKTARVWMGCSKDFWYLYLNKANRLLCEFFMKKEGRKDLADEHSNERWRCLGRRQAGFSVTVDIQRRQNLDDGEKQLRVSNAPKYG
jgi:hypothetical protein